MVIFAAALLVVFTAFRSSDLMRLPVLIGNLGGGPIFGDLTGSIAGIIVAILVSLAWVGLGKQILRSFDRGEAAGSSVFLRLAKCAALGAAIWSTIWFLLGFVGAYRPAVAIGALAVGLVCFAIPANSLSLQVNQYLSWRKNATTKEWLLIALAGVPIILALIASLAPPIAKDTLLYHFSVPRAFIAQGGNALIEGNIASYLALGTEMHALWAMLLGDLLSIRSGEAAAGATTFLFFPLLLCAVFGWARQVGVSRLWSLIAVVMIATVPTVFHVASSGYVDLSLALYVALAVYCLTQWWRSFAAAPLILSGIFLGAALTVKLTAVIIAAAFALIILLRARSHPNPGKFIVNGLGVLVLAGAIASPWYLRTWSATGSPVFPFYMSIVKGSAPGWDIERSNLFQLMTAHYGGASDDPVNYLTAPLRLSLAAQPEDVVLYDGVLGATFLIGLPLLIWAAWKRSISNEVLIAAGVAGMIYIFWLFSSPQLRYLLPAIPLVAVAIVAAAGSADLGIRVRSAWKYSIVTASILACLTAVAWFCQKAPVRVVLGGESRDAYLTRNLDYIPYYQVLNGSTPEDAKVWLINMRRDTYYLDRPVFADYIFEDWTLKKLLWESQNTSELRAKAAAMDIKYVLTRYDFLFDYDKSTLVDDKKPRAENEAKLKIARDFILDPASTIKSDKKFSLIKIF